MMFVTARLKGERDTRQGWQVPGRDDLIIGESGVLYDVSGEVCEVTNPPLQPSKAACETFASQAGLTINSRREATRHAVKRCTGRAVKRRH